MNILEQIKQLKKIAGNTQSFKELLEKANETEFEDKNDILEHFNNINIKEKGEYIHLKYNNRNMFKRAWDEFFLKTRGLVINWKEGELVLYPFDKFFELDEHKTTKLNKVKEDWKKAKTLEITEKIDGSLIIARYYKGELFVSSSGSLEGPHVEIAKEIINKNKEIHKYIKDFHNYTIVLEMKNTQIPQLIKYQEDTVTIIGMRNMDTLKLLTLKEIKELSKDYEVPIVKEIKLDMKEILNILEDPQISNNEGYVIRIDDLLVKFKTKNFIMANRFMGEASRNFNMVVEAINENRIQAITPMISSYFQKSFEVTVELIKGYSDEKEKHIRSMYEEISHIAETSDFAKEANKQFHKYQKDLLAMRENRYIRLNKEDIKFLKKFSENLVCVSHVKYAEQVGKDINEIEELIKNGKIKYLEKYYDQYNQKDVYIINKWQFLDFDEAKYRK